MTDCYHGEKEALLGFLDREFPGRWEYEAGTALQHGKAPEEIIMLWTPDRSELIGYCMLTVEKDARQQPNGRGGLGPIGIAKKSGDIMWEIIYCISHFVSFGNLA